MSRYQLRQPDLNFTDSRRATGDNDDTSSIENYSDTQSIFDMKSAIQAEDPVTYTDEVISGMSTNDLVFAWRNLKEPKSIADYM